MSYRHPETLPISIVTRPIWKLPRHRLSQKGLTIAPVAPPLNFVAADFLKTIQSYKEQAAEQGWISGAGIVTSLDVKLNVASAALARSDKATATNVLNAFLNEVSAQTGKTLSPEAVALLTFNVQYLITKLQ